MSNDLLANTNQVLAAETIGNSAVSFPDKAASSHASAFSRALLFFLGDVVGFAGASAAAFAGLVAGRAFFRQSRQMSAKSRCPNVPPVPKTGLNWFRLRPTRWHSSTWTSRTERLFRSRHTSAEDLALVSAFWASPHHRS